jgi:site-specific DNA recombinase
MAGPVTGSLNGAAVEKKISKLEERVINDEIEPDTYKKYYRKCSSEKAVLKEELLHLKGADAATIEHQQRQISKLCRVSKIFEESELSGKHAFLKRVFKHGITFKNGAFRTPYIHPLFDHNLLIINEK